MYHLYSFRDYSLTGNSLIRISAISSCVLTKSRLAFALSAAARFFSARRISRSAYSSSVYFRTVRRSNSAGIWPSIQSSPLTTTPPAMPRNLAPSLPRASTWGARKMSLALARGPRKRKYWRNLSRNEVSGTEGNMMIVVVLEGWLFSVVYRGKSTQLKYSPIIAPVLCGRLLQSVTRRTYIGHRYL